MASNHRGSAAAPVDRGGHPVSPGCDSADARADARLRRINGTPRTSCRSLCVPWSSGRIAGDLSRYAGLFSQRTGVHPGLRRSGGQRHRECGYTRPGGGGPLSGERVARREVLVEKHSTRSSAARSRGQVQFSIRGSSGHPPCAAGSRGPGGAHAHHHNVSRGNGPFIMFNCAGCPKRWPGIGAVRHERGATGATADRTIRAGQRGTIFSTRSARSAWPFGPNCSVVEDGESARRWTNTIKTDVKIIAA